MAVIISIVLPVYNTQDCIEACVDSLLCQTFSDFELICVDDGSTDATPGILDRYAAADGRVKVLHRTNAGPGAARNAGLDEARGSYVIFLDSDDIFDARMLEKLYARASQTGADVVVCRSRTFDHRTGAFARTNWTVNEAQLPPGDTFCCVDMPDFIFSAFVGWPWDKFYRLAFVREEGLRFPTLANSEDLYFVFLSLVKAHSISIVEDVLIDHRVNRGSSVSNSRAKEPLQFYESICLLKGELQKDPQTYERVSWGFLNWAMSYLLWNTENMTDPEGRRIMLDALAADAFPELEIDRHCPAFFSLDPSLYGRYTELMREAVGCAETPDLHDRHPRLSYVVAFFQNAQAKGFRHAFGELVRWAKRKTVGGEPAPDMFSSARRGFDLPLLGSNARERFARIEANEGEPR